MSAEGGVKAPSYRNVATNDPENSARVDHPLNHLHTCVNNTCKKRLMEAQAQTWMQNLRIQKQLGLGYQENVSRKPQLHPGMS
jgi:hypothetical protein